MSTVVKTFSLDSETDAALLRQLNKLERGELSAVVRDALKAHFQIANGVTLHMVLAEVQSLGRKLDSGVVVTGAQGSEQQALVSGDNPASHLMDLGA